MPSVRQILTGIALTRWKCQRCGMRDAFQHPAKLTGKSLIEEVRLQHLTRSPTCQWCDTKVTIQRI